MSDIFKSMDQNSIRRNQGVRACICVASGSGEAHHALQRPPGKHLYVQ